MKMTTKRVDKREKDIKKKLSAAILMLLVSCIMVVTSTYAWFTLSTAPEVTGIQTTIGGNGNLEIALANYEVQSDGTIIDSWTNTTTYPVATLTGETQVSATHDRNITWGNLVDLGATETVGTAQKNIYGLDDITLYPAALNVQANGTVDTEKLIKIPTYGADGRINTLTDNVVSGILNDDRSGFGTSGYGVRSIGVSSSMTKRQFAFRDAISDMSLYQNMAVNETNTTVSDSGNVLANLAVKIGMDSAGTETYTQDEMDDLIVLIEDLQEASSKIETAIVASVQGAIASARVQGTLNDVAYEAILPYLNDITYTSLSINGNNEIIVDLGQSGITNPIIPAELAASIITNMTKYQVIDAKLTNAANATKSNADKATTYTEKEIRAPLDYLMNIGGDVTVAGMTVAQIRADKEGAVNTIVNKLTNAQKIVVKLGSESSVLYDIAEMAGNLSSKVDCSITHQSVGTINTQVYIETTIANDARPTLTDLQTVINALGSPNKDTTTVSLIDDAYAFAIDLFFRTNATESNLLLQTAAAQRIYSDATNEDTMGGGSSMTFSSYTLDTASIRALMENIKVVFISADADSEGEILATAGLDLAEGNYIVNADKGITAELRLYHDVTIDNGDGTSTTRTELITDDTTAQEIMALTRNQAHKVTVLVYLDGETVENGDVSTAMESMTGTMNLQFASDANLQAMNYTELNQKNDSDEENAETLAAPTGLTVSQDGVLTITDDTNPSGTSYKVSITGTATSETTITAKTTNLTLANGTYTISVVATDSTAAKADSSAKSINVTVAEGVYTMTDNS